VLLSSCKHRGNDLSSFEEGTAANRGLLVKAVLVGACAFVLLLAVLVPGGATAAPPGNGLNVQVGAYTCDGEVVTLTNSSGPVAWIGSTHLLILSQTVTFTPFVGEPFTTTGGDGKKTGLTDETITCTKSGEYSAGTYVSTVVAVVVP
jgi:hypothetical protein